MSSKAKLRVCASCEWIFQGFYMCPQCGFGHYSARYVYGNACYRLKVTQKPWIEGKERAYALTLFQQVIEKSQFNRVRK